MITKRGFVLRGSCFCDKYILLYYKETLLLSGYRRAGKFSKPLLLPENLSIKTIFYKGVSENARYRNEREREGERERA